MNRDPRIALTTGEPAGVGPDLVVRLAMGGLDAVIVAFADPDLIEARAHGLGLALKVDILASMDDAPAIHRAGRLPVIPFQLLAAVKLGVPDPANARYVITLLDEALSACRAGQCDAMVTAPIHKAVINQAGMAFTGHTEYLASKTGACTPVMLLTTPKLRVALVTTHLALARVPEALTGARLRAVIGVLDADLRRYFDIKTPRISVCGLNPHAGEGGYLGVEEVEIISPVIRDLKRRGLHLTGPMPADTAFTEINLDQCDVVLAMYHDQGLPVLKYQGFGEAVNVTLGLPIIRTSVDHGTALDLAGTLKADCGSLMAALREAARMARSVAA